MGSDEDPRRQVEAAGAGKKSCTLAELSHCAYMESCSHRKQLPESIKNCNPLLSERNDAVNESAPTTKKRIKIDEKAEDNSRRVHARNVLNLQSEGFRSSVFASSSEENNGDGGMMAMDDINQPIRDSEGSDKLGDDRTVMNENGDGGSGSGRKDANVIKWPMFKDLGGMSNVIRTLERNVLAPLYHFKLLRHFGVEPMARVLFLGPPGCGKTTLARAVANEAGVPFYEISAAKLVSGVSGACEENIRELFSKAYTRSPSIVFIDEIDSFTSKMENLGKEIEPRVVDQLMACMDESCRLIKPLNHNVGSESCHSTPGYVLVIGATNRPDAVDPALRQRFDREIVLDVPDDDKRLEILSVLTRNRKVHVRSDLEKIARCTMGFVGRDLAALLNKAGVIAVNRIMRWRRNGIFQNPDGKIFCKSIKGNPKATFSDEEIEKLRITWADYEEATRTVQPSSKIEELYTIPNAKWDDVVGLQLLKQEFDHHIIRPIKFRNVYKDLWLKKTGTFFLYGPSGCGKSMIVEALANEAGANFIRIECPQLLNTYGDGDHTRLVLDIIYSNAGKWSPCILFFDEVEALETVKGTNVLIKVLDILKFSSYRRGVYIICATNRPIDTQYMMFKINVCGSRCFDKERFDKYMYVPPPSPEERGMILKALSVNKPIDANVNLMAIGNNTACENMSGADLSTLMKEAVLAAVDRPTVFDGGCRTPWTIKDEDFKRALKKISPTVSPMSMEDYLSFSKGIDGAKFCDGRMKTQRDVS